MAATTALTMGFVMLFVMTFLNYDVGLEHIVEMHNLIPKLQLAVFPNSDHLIFANSDKLLPQIKEFLNTQ